MFKCLHWNEVESETVNPVIGRKVIAGDRLMIVRHEMKKGAVIPLHQHVHEQITWIQTGRVRLWAGGTETDLEADGVSCVPSDAPHKLEALEDTVAFDVFTPLREDFMKKP